MKRCQGPSRVDQAIYKQLLDSLSSLNLLMVKGCQRKSCWVADRTYRKKDNI